MPVHLAHANKVHYFARSKGVLAKTDRIDSTILTEYGRANEREADVVLLNEKTEKIAELLKRRDHLQNDKRRENNRLDKEFSAEITKSMKKHIKWLDQENRGLDKKLSELKQTDEVNSSHQLLESIPAIGDLTAYYLLSNLPEIGKVSHKKLAALVGVAPFNRDSGKGQGKRFIKGRRARLRQILYMSAITAIRHNPPLKAFYQRKRAEGKPGKVAIIAVVRKLLSMANSVMKRQTAWVDEYSMS